MVARLVLLVCIVQQILMEVVCTNPLAIVQPDIYATVVLSFLNRTPLTFFGVRDVLLAIIARREPQAPYHALQGPTRILLGLHLYRVAFYVLRDITALKKV